ncbi:MAG: gliding motility-associated ABC transporter ATP-binding subunit GldA [Chitinophagales bacterium]|nr:gliding motility-associated ABC transporter ATP-binding subunit GldA [Chitinophagales bacterium]
MSITVQKLSKEYQTQKAVDAIDFSIQPGEIVGFLGPNGAGKSTTMKMLTGFIPPSSGMATVCNFDIQKDTEQVKKNIGYLPEHNPLYVDMYVKEYLAFVAGVYQVKEVAKRVQEMIALTGLDKEQGKLIRQLSKGYRQRVGLAAAMIHDPKVLILDEPTTGLDPNQIVEIRNVIKQIGKDKTVLLSSHIMQEVQAICSRVIIIHQGKLVLDSPIEDLKKRAGDGFVYLIELETEIANEAWKEIGGVKKVEQQGALQWRISADKDIRNVILQKTVQMNWGLKGLQEEKQSLEAIFQQLTQAKN